MLIRFRCLTLLVLSFLFTLSGCDQPTCESTHLTFTTYAPEAKVYREKLATQLASLQDSEPRYWVDSYHEANGSTYLRAAVNGTEFCAQMDLLVEGTSAGIAGIINSKGAGYRGAELVDLEYTVRQGSAGPEFVFQRVGRVVD